ncbi:PAS domain S-box-containing protein [Catalinimonas alkaloidigena]|uniref:ATP-binding protein n=1 Tax=Catalinimonas alkaloidigena TaxID=1075417 RepID=UPI002406D253|nr:ATP-binding protein [Catalinimonas alkaloidigena]MDF9796902.1 PAS domain S-box-containing protein [Catalinimonas alkaloidigena]
MPQKSRIEDINNMIIKIASGDFDHKIEISDSFDEIDAIVSGINMLGEELKATVIAKNYLKSIFEGIVDMLIIFDEHFLIKEVNNKVTEILGIDESQLLGQPIENLFTLDDTKVIEKIKKGIANKGSLYNQETSFVNVNGDNIPVSISLSLLKDNNDSEKGFILIAKDLKHVLLTADALKQKNTELQTLVYKVSHDLKGPVASVMGLLELVDMAGDDLQSIKNYLDHIKKSLYKLNHTILSLFEYSLSSQPNFEVSSVTLKTLLEEVLSSYANYPGMSDMKIDLDILPSLSLMTGKKLLISLFQHIIENAINFRATHNKISQLKIKASTQGKSISISFEDNGMGMDKHVLARAFDMFYRGNEVSKGSGLGLFIAKSNVEKLGGEIKIKSKVDVGTEIIILLPSLTGSKITIS